MEPETNAFEYLYTLENKALYSLEDWEKLGKLSKDKDAQLRFLVALRVNQANRSARTILFRLADDKDELVRAQAYASMRNIAHSDVFEMLGGKIFTESDIPAKRNAILACMKIALELHVDSSLLIETLLILIEKNDDHDIRIACYEWLYRLGGGSYLHKLIAECQCDNPEHRLMAIKSLRRILDSANKPIIRKALMDLQQSEENLNVQTQLIDVLRYIEYEPW